MIFIGYEIREKYANDPQSPIPNYSLPIGNITMDSSLCRPLDISAYEINGYKIFLYYNLLDIEKCYQSAYIKGIDLDKYRIFGYFLEEEAIKLLQILEEKQFGNNFKYFRDLKKEIYRMSGNFQEIGYDVVCGAYWYDRWESLVSNDGIDIDILEQYGNINEFGLYLNYESADMFKNSINNLEYNKVNDRPFIAKIIASSD